MANYSKGLKRVIGIFVGFVVIALVTMLVYDRVQEGVLQVLYKQAYSKASYAWQQVAISKDADFSFKYESNIANFKMFQKGFNTVMECDSSDKNSCWAQGEMFFLTYPDKDSIFFVDEKGMSWASACSYKCEGEILVDVNGVELPNQYGRDRFMFYPVSSGAGMYADRPMNLKTPDDYEFENAYFCPSGNCLYKTLLK